jgi:glucoamylase
MKLSVISEKMKAYVGWVKKVQSETDPNGFDIRINPKFELPRGEPYVGGWCRPQTDGPGLRSGALIMFAKVLNDNGESSYATS